MGIHTAPDDATMDLAIKRYPLATLTIFFGIIIGLSLFYHFSVGYPNESVNEWDVFRERLTSLVVIFVVVVPVVMEVYDMFAAKFRERIEKRGEQKAHEKWVAWNNRRVAAEIKGEPFDEPPPTQILGGCTRNRFINE